MSGPESALSGAGKILRDKFKPAEDVLLSLRDVGLRRRAEYQQLRQSAEYQAVFDKLDPLVSIVIATYNRAELLRDRAVRSCLAQTYANIEVIVVGDCCTDDTPDVMAEVDDPRVRFVNLAERGNYPSEPGLRWMVAGTKPMNHGLSLARGDFVTHLDDDDEHEPERTQELLDFIRENRADVVVHPFLYELPNGKWVVNEARRFRHGQATTSSVFYHGYLGTIEWDPLAYRLREPGDWNRLRKIKFMGADIRRHPGRFLKHYLERNQRQP